MNAIRVFFREGAAMPRTIPALVARGGSGLGRFLISGFAALACGAAQAAPRPSALFSDHAVLQRGAAVPVWGRAVPGEAIRVIYREASAETVTGADGRWSVALPTLDVGPAAKLIIEGETTLTFSDVVVGDVWFCSGQSNMGWTVAKSEEPAADIAAAEYPLIRRFRVARKTSAEPLDDVSGEWELCSPKTVPGWTAVGFYFARDIHRSTGAAVGLLQASIGGTDIETWMSPEAIDASAAGAAVRRRWADLIEAYPRSKAIHDEALAGWRARKRDAEAAGQAFREAEPREPRGPEHGSRPSRYFNGMVRPVIPYALRGVLWYQGENNAGRAEEYADLQVRLIRDWRMRWGKPELPFLFVQMPAMSSRNPSGLGWADFREAQTRALTEPATGMAVTIDVGSGGAHPPYKRQVGERLALLARSMVYGERGVPAPPRPLSFVVEEDRLVLRFDAGGAPLVLKPETGGAPPFELAGEDGVYRPAKAVLEGDTVILRGDAVATPRHARYAWRNYPAPALFNSAGLPAAPFRTDQP